MLLGTIISMVRPVHVSSGAESLASVTLLLGLVGEYVTGCQAPLFALPAVGDSAHVAQAHEVLAGGVQDVGSFLGS